MSPDRLKVAISALVSIVLIVVSAFAMDWFVLHRGPDADYYTLRAMRRCLEATHACTKMSLPPGEMYSRTAPGTAWGSLAIAALVAFQAGTRLITGSVSSRLTKLGYLATISMFGTAFFSGYIFAPDIPAPNQGASLLTTVEISLDRGWAPLVAIIGYAISTFAIYFAAAEGTPHEGAGAYKPIVIDKSDKKPPVQHSTMPTPRPAAPQQDGRTRGKVRFAAVSADVSRAGIDAQREDGSAVLVAWRDITRVFARRMPADAPFNGVVAVDIVSKAGATIRIVPWTKLTGESFDTDTDARARTFVQLVSSRCPALSLDPPTNNFASGSNPATQLRDAAALAAHDDAIA